MKHRRPVRDQLLLKQRLDSLVEAFDVSTITPDPLELVLRYREARDQEIAGILAAAFAYGRADIVVRNVGQVLARMGTSPADYVQRFDATRDATTFQFFAHRFHKAADLVALLERLHVVLARHGSLGELFRSCDDGEGDVEAPLTRFVGAIISAVPADEPTLKPLRYLLTSPADGSACKRMNLFLRWMVRRTPPDLGLWTFVPPRRLVMPLDTHVHRISAFLGLNERKAANWRTARELTDQLARFDGDDPVRYDFAICRLGILDHCSRTRRKESCAKCLLLDVCRFPLLR